MVKIQKIKDAQKLVKNFAKKNNWKDVPNIDKFDHIHEELIEMSQYLRYKNEKQRIKEISVNKQVFEDGIGDLFFAICRLANQLNVDIENAFNMASCEIFKKYDNKNKEINISSKRKKL